MIPNCGRYTKFSHPEDIHFHSFHTPLFSEGSGRFNAKVYCNNNDKPILSCSHEFHKVPQSIACSQPQRIEVYFKRTIYT
jgi:hypothetical protein